MWCPNCQADIAAEISADHRRVRCAACGTDIIAKPPATGEKTRQARELLQRWSSDDVLEPLRTASQPAGPAASPSKSHPPATETPTSEMKSILRFDGPHTVSEQATTSSDSRNESQPASRPSTPPAEPSEANTRIDMAHDWPTTPHFRRRTPKRRRTNWTSVAGHVLAYSGVLALTLGALYIVVGYFGGPDYYAPRGWFITTTGQMLLFLGVITLVSSGMEQTADEVARRIDVLGEKILRIEQAAANPTFHRPPISSDSRNESSSERRTSRGSAEP